MENPNNLVFVGDRLEVRDPDALKRLDRKRWSASGVKAIESCPARWVTDKLIPEDPDPFGAAEIGTSAHKVLELLYQLPMPERTEARAMEILSTLDRDFGNEVVAPTTAGELMDWRGQVASKVIGDFSLEDPTTIDVVGTELRLENEVGGVPLIGFIDRLDRLPDGTVKANDFKSGRVKRPSRYGDDHGDQIRLYAASLRADGWTTTEGALLYIGGPERREVSIVDSEVDRVVEDFVSTYTEMKDSAKQGSYRTEASPLCGWCPLVTVCPTAAANNRSTPRSPRAMLGTSLGVRTEVFTAAAPVVQDEVIEQAEAPAEAAQPKTPTRKKRPMYKWSATEEKTWVPTLATGELNPNSYAAVGYAGTAGLAVELIFGESNPNKTPKVGEIAALTKTLDHIVRKVWADLTGTTELTHDHIGSGLATRIRGVMRSVLTFTPLPFGGSAADWETWVTTMVKRIELVMDNAMELHVGKADDAPWSGLAN